MRERRRSRRGLPRSAAVPALLKRSPTGPSVQTLACLGLSQIDDPRVVPALISTLNDARKEDATRAACAYAIGARRSPTGIPALLGALTDNRGEAQRLAAWGLGQIGDGRALGPLIPRVLRARGRSADDSCGRSAASAAAGSNGAAGPGEIRSSAASTIRSPRRGAPGRWRAADAGKLGSSRRRHREGPLDALGEHRDVVVSC